MAAASHKQQNNNVFATILPLEKTELDLKVSRSTSILWVQKA